VDLIVRNSRLRDRPGAWDIGVRGERIVEVAERIAASGAEEIHAEGRLVAPTYVNGHIHLDKCNLSDVMPPRQIYSAQEPLERTWAHKRAYTVEDILRRAGQAIEEGIFHGTTVFRGFADVDTIGGLRPLEGVLALRERWRDRVRIEVVAFPQEAIVRDPGTRELMEEAMRMGADVVGGIPWLEDLDEDVRAHVDFCFDLAGRYDRDIHMLVDNTLNPYSRSLEVLAVKTKRAGYQGRVSASHAEAVAAYDEYHAQKVLQLVKEAGVSISANAPVTLGFEGRLDREPIRRGLTRVKQMWRMGINVFASQDDVDDPWYPFGRNDQQEVAGYLAHTAQMTYPEELDAVFDCVTTNAARALRLADYGVEPGCRADFNVLAAASVHQVLRLQQPPPWVVRGGRVLARNQLTRELRGA